MTKGIFKDTLLDSGVTSTFLKVATAKMDLKSRDVLFVIEYYLDEPAFDNGFLPIQTKEFFLDSGFVGQFELATNKDIEIFIYNLLNTAIQGTVDNE